MGVITEGAWTCPVGVIAEGACTCPVGVITEGRARVQWVSSLRGVHVSSGCHHLGACTCPVGVITEGACTWGVSTEETCTCPVGVITEGAWTCAGVSSLRGVHVSSGCHH